MVMQQIFAVLLYVHVVMGMDETICINKQMWYLHYDYLIFILITGR